MVYWLFVNKIVMFNNYTKYFAWKQKKCLQKKYIEWSTFKSMSTRISNEVKECTKRSHAVTNCLWCATIILQKNADEKRYLGTSDKNLKITSKYLLESLKIKAGKLGFINSHKWYL